jgi:hypothetical protein
MRHLPVSKRPELFTSASGKEIPVAKTISIKNEVILEKGRVSAMDLCRGAGDLESIPTVRTQGARERG